MNYNFILPKKHKAYGIEPKYKEWINFANHNMINRQKWNFYICDTKAIKFKEMVTDQILKEAYSFCAEKNIRVLQKDLGSYVFTTGHQSVFYHSGIWLKNFLINEYSKNDNITGLNIWLDYEEGCHEEFVVPYYLNKRYGKKNIPFNVPVCHNVTSSLPPPTDNLWKNFTEQVRICLKTIPSPAVLDNFENYLISTKKSMETSENLAEFIALSRRYYEQGEDGKNYLELPVSRILKKDSFLIFFIDMLNKIDGLCLIYNHVLDTYRSEHMIKNNANPFPNLRIQDNLFELPFWVVLPSGRRAGIWYDKGKNCLFSNREKIIKLDKNNEKSLEILKETKYKIVFKAVTLMMYFRTFASDFFLHGSGGAKYDAITDQIIQKFYNINPPAYAAATANLYLDLPKINYNEKEKFETEKKLIQIKHNPQKFIPENVMLKEPGIKELIKEKEQLIKKIKNIPLDDKKIISDKIKEVNTKLEKTIAPLKKELEIKFEALSEKEQENNVATFREYPFCFYNPDDMEDLVKTITRDRLRGCL